MIGKPADVRPTSLDVFKTYITVNYCFNIQSFETFLVVFQVAGLPHRYSGFLLCPVSQFKPHNCLDIRV